MSAINRARIRCLKFNARQISALFFWMGLVSCLSGCGGVRGYYSTYSEDFHPGPHTHVLLGPIDDHTPDESRAQIPADFKPAAELQEQLERELQSANLMGLAGQGDVVTVFPTIVDYQPGNAFVRWAAAGAPSGATVLLVRCRVEESGKQVGTVNVRRTVESGGVYSIGQWKVVFQGAAADIANELKLKIHPQK